MLLFLASVLEQLDVSLEHLKKNDVHNARFSLMLTDNIVELVLHQIAKDKKIQLRWSHDRDDYQHARALEKALQRSFEAKVSYARLEGQLAVETAQTISILHNYRNEVYHIGLHHEAILHDLAAFYFDVACEFVSGYEPYGLSWGSNMEMPERARKYFTGDPWLPGKSDDYKNGCAAMRVALGFQPQILIDALAAHLDQIISEQDTCLDIVAGGVYDHQRTTRDRAIVDSQAWTLAFEEEGKMFAQQNGFPGGSVLAYVQWLAANYPFKYGKDPLPSWQKIATKLATESNPHSALNRYHSFMEGTAEIRELLTESAGLVEREIDALIDRARGK